MQQEHEAAGPSVLPSSTELFYFYGQTMEQCGKYTTGEPMKKLGNVFAKWLKIYSGEYSSVGFTGPFTDSTDDVLSPGMKRYEYGEDITNKIGKTSVGDRLKDGQICSRSRMPV